VSPATKEGSPPTAAQILAQHHVSLSRDGLVSALRSDDAEIRSLAAEQLAVQGAEDSIPSVVEALEAEKIPKTRVDIAFALAQMGDERGIRALRQDCDNTTLPMYLRLSAASYLLYVRDQSCLRTVVEGLQPSYESGTRIQALSLIPRFKGLSASESAGLRVLVLKSLRDQDPAVRLVASDTIRILGDLTAIPSLEAAISAEADVEIRTQMESDLRALQRTK